MYFDQIEVINVEEKETVWKSIPFLHIVMQKSNLDKHYYLFVAVFQICIANFDHCNLNYINLIKKAKKVQKKW